MIGYQDFLEWIQINLELIIRTVSRNYCRKILCVLVQLVCVLGLSICSYQGKNVNSFHYLWGLVHYFLVDANVITEMLLFIEYKPAVHPAIAHVFQSAAMRFGHTMVTPGVMRRYWELASVNKLA